MDVNETYYGHHFAIYTCNKSLCCAPKTNTMLYVNYVSIKLEMNEKNIMVQEKGIVRRLKM